jgi:hypothetical protein
MQDNQNRTSRTGQTGFSQLDKTQAEFNVPPSVISSKLTDGGEYLVISRTRQGETPKIWSTGDQEQTQHLYDQFARTVDLQPAG